MRRVPRWSRACALALALVLVLSAAACGGQDSGSGTDSGRDDVDTIERSDVASDLDSADYSAGELTYEAVLAGPIVAPEALPFTGLALDPVARTLFEQAAWVIRQPCLEAEGFDEPTRSWEPPAVDGDSPARRYYYVPADRASDLGYSRSPTAGGEGARAQADYDRTFDAMVEEMGEGEREEFGEVLTDCLRAAERELCVDGDLVSGDGYCRKSLEMLSDLDATSYRVAEGSPAVGEAVERWSACMAQIGYRFDSVPEAWQAAEGLEDLVEVAQAVVDTACKDQARLVDVWATVEARVQDEMIEREPDYFADLTGERDALLARAQAVVAEAG